MNVSPNEAEEALAAINQMTEKTRHSIASTGAHVTLIVTGIVWLVGYVSTQFLSGNIVMYIWIALSVIGGALGTVMGLRRGSRVRGPSTTVYAKRVGLFWLLLIFYGAATLLVAQPADGKQLTMLVILFIMVGQLAMGLVFSFSATWWAVPITLLAMAGYFFFPQYFYAWMGVLGGGGMIALGLYIRARW